MTTDTREELDASRRQAILDAATGVFFRYGYKKTSMDSVARAAGISRQWLYHYFETKEQLFAVLLEHIVDKLVGIARQAAENQALPPGERLHKVLAALYDDSLPYSSQELVLELASEAKAHQTDIVTRLHRQFLGLLTTLLTDGGIAARWQATGIQADQLAEQLLATARGLKTSAGSREAYRDKLSTAIRIILGNADTPA